MDIKGWIKAHPYSTGALVIGGGLVFIMLSGWFSGGSSSTVAVSSQGVSDAQLAAQTQVQMAQIAASSANVQSANELKAAELAAGLQATIAKLTADTAKYQVDADRSVNLASIGAQSSYQAQNIAAQTQMFTIQNQTALEVAKLDALVNTKTVDATKEVSLAQVATQNKQIEANTSVTQAIIEALKPQAPTVVTTPTPTPTVVTTPTPTTPKFDNVWEAVLVDRPDVAAGWYSTAYKDPKYGGSMENWAEQWYYQWGASSGYQLPQL